MESVLTCGVVDKTVGYAGDQFLFGWNYLDFSSGWPVVASTGEKNIDS
jgi:arabinan endo-1,5-alpha-L-arabinosidase